MPRSGQWMQFLVTERTEVIDLGKLKDLPAVQAALIAAHKAGTKVVGIYLKPGRDPLTQQKTPAMIVPVEKNTGANLAFLLMNPEPHLVNRIAFVPESVDGLEPCTSREQIPAARLPDDPEWQPEA